MIKRFVVRIVHFSFLLLFVLPGQNEAQDVLRVVEIAKAAAEEGFLERFLRDRAVTHVMLLQVLLVAPALVYRHEGVLAVAQAPSAFIQPLMFHSNQVHSLGQTSSVSPHFGLAVLPLGG